MGDLSRKEKILLEEYKLCQQKAQGFEGPIWQTSSIIGLGSIGALLVIATQGSQIDPYVFLGAGLFVNLVAWIWYKMAGRFWSIQHTALMRLDHVELELKEIYLNRYIKRRDARATPLGCKRKKKSWVKKCWSESVPMKYASKVDGLQDRRKKKRKSKRLKDFVRFGSQFYSRCFLALNAFAWVVYIFWFFRSDKPFSSISQFVIKYLGRCKDGTVAAIVGVLIFGFFGYYVYRILKQKFDSDRLEKEKCRKE